MIAITIEPFSSKLQNRLRVVLRTLKHVHEEQQLIDESQELIDRAAYLSRCRLLDTLAESYEHEITRIEEALERVRRGNYGLCAACRQPIASQRLELAPEAAFCADCQNFRETVAEN